MLVTTLEGTFHVEENFKIIYGFSADNLDYFLLFLMFTMERTRSGWETWELG